MTLLDMQRVFSRLLTDGEFQRAFVAGDESAWAPYELSERELRSLRGLKWDWVNLHSHLLAHGRMEMALKGLPLTQGLVQDQLHKHLDRYCQEYPPVPEAASAVYIEANRMTQFIGRLAAEGLLRPAWAAEVAEYERVMLVLSITAEAADSAAVVAALNGQPDGPAVELTDVVPVAGAHTHVASFRYPLVDILPLLDSGVLPTDVHPADRPLMVLFHKVAGTHQTQTMKINPATAALLELCDGERTVREIVDRLVGTYGSGVERGAVTVLDRLRAAGVIGLRKGAWVCAA
jgi:hypothetical protein